MFTYTGQYESWEVVIDVKLEFDQELKANEENIIELNITNAFWFIIDKIDNNIIFIIKCLQSK